MGTLLTEQVGLSWLTANRLAGTDGIFDNLVTNRRERWMRGVLLHTTENATIIARSRGHEWGAYPDHPFNKAKP